MHIYVFAQPFPLMWKRTRGYDTHAVSVLGHDYATLIRKIASTYAAIPCWGQFNNNEISWRGRAALVYANMP